MKQEHLDKIIELANIHAPKYVFGMYTREDLVQEAILMGIDAYTRWDGVRPFANFICKHISNRLKTFKRDKYFRPNGGSTKNQEAKKSLAEGAGNTVIQLSYSIDFWGLFAQKEIIEKIELNIPHSMRRNYLRLRDGAKMDFDKKRELLTFIRGLING